MNRFEKVIEILDTAVGGPTASVGFHGAFWRGLTRDQFVSKKVLGLQLIVVGNGSESNLVKALKGATPFGADSGNPEADFNRMPSGLPAVSDADIDFIKKWIDEGCLEDELIEVVPLTWRKTNAPIASSRTDDIWFIDPQTGWAVNSDGNILKTTDGGNSWNVQHSSPGAYLRCVGFANANVGWVGTLSPARRLFHTVDGGANWARVSPLPTLAPVAICGISVVNENIVYCSGTNRPNDFPRMMKTIDGGTSWTAWDMSAHASVLIDCFFVDSLHGWVVGGKSSEPTPTSRDKLKPVVLETNDGGATWVNRLAGQEANFPFGEWGWKIQFIGGGVGFVSLENFSDAAILKTIDGGTTWQRIAVNDPQENVNLEGIGFIDEQHGWVGGWGPGGFGGVGSPQGFSSATSDGGVTWQSANEIGLFINRFRFFGNPVHVGFASGDTVYKYSSDPLPSPAVGLVAKHDPARAMLPTVQISGQTGAISIPMNVPTGTKRLSLLVWDRFGDDIGCILDEIHPVNGTRVFEWDGTDSRGIALPAGDYIVRLIADDLSASSRIRLEQPSKRSASLFARRQSAQRFPKAFARKSRFATIADFVAVEQADIDDLRDALQIAIQLELSTLPPYLIARWTIKDPSDPIAESIMEIRGEEMLHFGLACNLLASIDGFPLIAHSDVVPKYPAPLPGGVRPGLEVKLRKLSRDQAAVFMEIEYPQHGPITLVESTSLVTIGEFYQKILQDFQRLNPPLVTNRQIEKSFHFGRLFKIDTPKKFAEAIRIINLQGEGSSTSPEEADGDLAHYYRFGEVFHGRRYVKNEAGRWDYLGDPLPMPAVHDMADIPPGGYRKSDVPDSAIWDLIERFDRAYSDMLHKLQETWHNGTPASLGQAVSAMMDMGTIGEELITKRLPGGQGNYGPCFRFVN